MRKLSISSDEGLVPIRTIQQFAEDVGVVFPVSYVSLLSKHDHLYPKENIFNLSINTVKMMKGTFHF